MHRYPTLFLHLVRILFLISKPQGTKALVAENLMLRKQLIVLSRKYQRAPNLSFWDRLSFAIYSLLIKPSRLFKLAIIIKPATLIKFHDALVKRKYSLLFSSKSHRKPGPNGPSKELIQLILEMKQRNPSFGCPRIAMQIQNSFNIDIDKDVVRRVLQKYHKNCPNNNGPSWLSFLGDFKDSLWSIDLFRCESIHLKTHWVMLLMDQFTRSIIGFAVHKGNLNGTVICCMFNNIISQKSLPKYLSSDNDPLFLFHQWKANLRILDIKEIKTLPYMPLSHPFVERLIKSVRHELLDKSLFWNEIDLQNKLNRYQTYFNNTRSHKSLNGTTPSLKAQTSKSQDIKLSKYQWKSYCNQLFQLPIAA